MTILAQASVEPKWLRCLFVVVCLFVCLFVCVFTPRSGHAIFPHRDEQLETYNQELSILIPTCDFGREARRSDPRR